MTARVNFSRKKVIAIWNKTNGKCIHCGKELTFEKNILDDGGKPVMSIRLWEIDHLKPFSKGGSHELSNLAASCKECNRKKKNNENYTVA